MTATTRRLTGFGGAVVAAGMTVLWTVVVPDKADTATGLQALTIRYGHPVCWALLAGAGVSYAVGAPQRVTSALAWTGLGAYAAFLVALSV